jgi:hypothetical protein
MAALIADDLEAIRRRMSELENERVAAQRYGDLSPHVRDELAALLRSGYSGPAVLDDWLIAKVENENW